MWGRPSLICLLILAAAASPSAANAPDPAANFITKTLGIASYRTAVADLNGDGRPEIFAYSTDPGFCGSGGCTLVILSPKGNGFNVVLHSTVTQLPILLLKTSTHGWRDIAVAVGGGGITNAYVAKLRFNGRKYPGNPTVVPAIPIKRAGGSVLIS